ncbi:MAG: hypothetical protein HOJ79_12020 [Nitrospina sp.]|jgi:hypothetical protein|nr:hypothetical protein [Nitrospina sp.]
MQAEKTERAKPPSHRAEMNFLSLKHKKEFFAENRSLSFYFKIIWPTVSTAIKIHRHFPSRFPGKAAEIIELTRRPALSPPTPDFKELNKLL